MVPLTQLTHHSQQYVEETQSYIQPPTSHALHQERRSIITRFKSTPVDTDHPFTLHDLEQTTKTSTDTSPGSDEIAYSMIAHTGQEAKIAVLNLINHSWETRKIPNSWKQAIIQPIPKP